MRYKYATGCASTNSLKQNFAITQYLRMMSCAHMTLLTLCFRRLTDKTGGDRGARYIERLTQKNPPGDTARSFV